MRWSFFLSAFRLPVIFLSSYPGDFFFHLPVLMTFLSIFLSFSPVNFILLFLIRYCYELPFSFMTHYLLVLLLLHPLALFSSSYQPETVTSLGGILGMLGVGLSTGPSECRRLSPTEDLFLFPKSISRKCPRTTSIISTMARESIGQCIGDLT